jgi:hypothetical protein
MTKTIELTCDVCEKVFDKYIGEYKRRVREGHTKFACSLSCGAVLSNKTCKRPGNPSSIIPGKVCDEFSPFRWYLKVARNREAKKGKPTITLEYLKALWEDQKGICPITGWRIILPYGSKGWLDTDNPQNASLDRIDNSLGYVQGNVRFIAIHANFARWKYSDTELSAFCLAVVKNLNLLEKEEVPTTASQG